jgi:hypothetical protein
MRVTPDWPFPIGIESTRYMAWFCRGSGNEDAQMRFEVWPISQKEQEEALMTGGLSTHQ